MYQYDSCICCVSGDESHAENLAIRLEKYRAPKGIVLPDPELGYNRILRDFKGESFGEDQKQQLKNCRQLILICTPRTKAEPAVLQRLRFFEKERSFQSIIPVIAEGEPADSFPDFFIRQKRTEHILPDMTVTTRLETVEPVAADLRGATPKEREEKLRYEAVRIAATSLELHPNVLVRRHEVRRKRRIAAIAAVTAAVCLTVAGIFSWYGWQAARAADLSRRQQEEAELAANRLFVDLPGFSPTIQRHSGPWRKRSAKRKRRLTPLEAELPAGHRTEEHHERKPL